MSIRLWERFQNVTALAACLTVVAGHRLGARLGLWPAAVWEDDATAHRGGRL